MCRLHPGSEQERQAHEARDRRERDQPGAGRQREDAAEQDGGGDGHVAKHPDRVECVLQTVDVAREHHLKLPALLLVDIGDLERQQVIRETVAQLVLDMARGVAERHLAAVARPRPKDRGGDADADERHRAGSTDKGDPEYSRAAGDDDVERKAGADRVHQQRERAAATECGCRRDLPPAGSERPHQGRARTSRHRSQCRRGPPHPFNQIPRDSRGDAHSESGGKTEREAHSRRHGRPRSHGRRLEARRQTHGGGAACRGGELPAKRFEHVGLHGSGREPFVELHEQTSRDWIRPYRTNTGELSERARHPESQLLVVAQLREKPAYTPRQLGDDREAHGRDSADAMQASHP